MAGRGRKPIDISDWLTPANKLRIQGWCRDGLIEKQIYKNMGIGKSTFYKWKNENVEFAELLKESKVLNRKLYPSDDCKLYYLI